MPGGSIEEPGHDPSRNRLQTVTLLDAIEEHGFDALFGGGRRDEEKARAKERIFSHRDALRRLGAAQPATRAVEPVQRPHAQGRAHARVPDQQLDRARRLAVHRRRGAGGPVDLLRPRADGRPPRRHVAGGRRTSSIRATARRSPTRTVRYRTVGDMSCTGAVESRCRNARCGHRGGRGGPDHRARRDARRRRLQRGGDGRPQARGLLLMAVAADRVSPHRPYPASDLLRFSTAGSVDDGKSTLIGRLLHDSKGIFEDQLVAIEQASRRRGGDGLDLALLTDGLRAEREQGITIDVAYRYFATPRRKFIIADTPGHLQYTRNMVTGASTADLAVILVDARYGVARADAPAHRHRRAAARPAARRGCQQDGPRRVRRGGVHADPWTRSTSFARRLGVTDVTSIPVSALRGDNVVERSSGDAVVRRTAGPRVSSSPSRTTRSRPTVPSASRSSWSSDPPAPTIRTTGPTPAGSRAARYTPATPWSRCRRESRRGSPRSTRTTARSTRRSRRCRSPSG